MTVSSAAHKTTVCVVDTMIILSWITLDCMTTPKLTLLTLSTKIFISTRRRDSVLATLMHDERCTFLCPGGEDARTGGGGVVGVACMRVPMCVVFCKLNFGREPKKEIPKNDTHWLVRAVCATMLRLNLGTSVGNRRPLYHFEESQVHERISISIATPEKQKLDVPD